jgi:hypothetical protein
MPVESQIAPDRDEFDAATPTSRLVVTALIIAACGMGLQMIGWFTSVLASWVIPAVILTVFVWILTFLMSMLGLVAVYVVLRSRRSNSAVCIAAAAALGVNAVLAGYYLAYFLLWWNAG